MLWLLEELGLEYDVKYYERDAIEVVAMLAEQVESRPKLKKFIDRIHTRSAYERAIKRGGRYENFFVTEQSS